jgi:hypothetical protein
MASRPEAGDTRLKVEGRHGLKISACSIAWSK